MINKDNADNKKDKDQPDDTARCEISAHLVIKDKTIDKTVVNKRG